MNRNPSYRSWRAPLGKFRLIPSSVNGFLVALGFFGAIQTIYNTAIQKHPSLERLPHLTYPVGQEYTDYTARKASSRSFTVKEIPLPYAPSYQPPPLPPAQAAAVGVLFDSELKKALEASQDPNWIKTNFRISIGITGTASIEGDPEGNQSASQERARQVAALIEDRLLSHPPQEPLGISLVKNAAGTLESPAGNRTAKVNLSYQGLGGALSEADRSTLESIASAHHMPLAALLSAPHSHLLAAESPRIDGILNRYRKANIHIDVKSDGVKSVPIRRQYPPFYLLPIPPFWPGKRRRHESEAVISIDLTRKSNPETILSDLAQSVGKHMRDSILPAWKGRLLEIHVNPVVEQAPDGRPIGRLHLKLAAYATPSRMDIAQKVEGPLFDAVRYALESISGVDPEKQCMGDVQIVTAARRTWLDRMLFMLPTEGGPTLLSESYSTNASLLSILLKATLPPAQGSDRGLPVAPFVLAGQAEAVEGNLNAVARTYHTPCPDPLAIGRVSSLISPGLPEHPYPLPYAIASRKWFLWFQTSAESVGHVAAPKATADREYDFVNLDLGILRKVVRTCRPYGSHVAIRDTHLKPKQTQS